MTYKGICIRNKATLPDGSNRHAAGLKESSLKYAIQCEFGGFEYTKTIDFLGSRK